MSNTHILAGHNGLPGGTWDEERHAQFVDNLQTAYFTYVADYGKAPNADELATMRATALDALVTDDEKQAAGGNTAIDTSPLAQFTSAQIKALLKLLAAKETQGE